MTEMLRCQFDPPSGGSVTLGPGDRGPSAAGRGHLRASDGDREQMVDTLKAAFAAGGWPRTTSTPGSARRSPHGRTRNWPRSPSASRPARPWACRPRACRPGGWATQSGGAHPGFVTPAILAIAFALNSLPGSRALGPVAFVIAFVYFVFWMSVGADMLWQWFCLSLPTARMCVRCAHTAASHRAPTSCSVRLGSLGLFSRCSCAGYVPPGVSPKTADLRILSTRV